MKKKLRIIREVEMPVAMNKERYTPGMAPVLYDEIADIKKKTEKRVRALLMIFSVANLSIAIPRG
ncbi:MAG TPA: hypothetical protein PK573_03735 [Spirochaetota bacterium]|nr:hypothetical protein [Spirochaetota bacterium]